MRRAFRGIWIPAEIWLHPRLSMTEKVTLAEVDSLDNGGGCYASNEYLSRFLGVSERTLRSALATLRAEGYITTEMEKGRIRLIHTTEAWKNLPGRAANSAGQGGNRCRPGASHPHVDNKGDIYKGDSDGYKTPGPERTTPPTWDEIPADIAIEARINVETGAFGPKTAPKHPAYDELCRREAARLMSEMTDNGTDTQT